MALFSSFFLQFFLIYFLRVPLSIYGYKNINSFFFAELFPYFFFFFINISSSMTDSRPCVVRVCPTLSVIGMCLADMFHNTSDLCVSSKQPPPPQSLIIWRPSANVTLYFASIFKGSTGYGHGVLLLSVILLFDSIFSQAFNSCFFP